VPADAQKLLSFTDNRQDASLQAGHLNDFTQVVLLRGALLRALGPGIELPHDRIGDAVFSALNPSPEDFMKEPVDGGPGYENARRAMVDLLEYRLLEDLARAWRVAQPNLEQCGLLRIAYKRGAKDEAAGDRGRWHWAFHSDLVRHRRGAELEHGAAVWRRIMDAVAQLTNTTPPGPVN
jgi:hypothetical protein